MVGGATRVGFGLVDWALHLSDKSWILRRGLAHYRLDKSLRPRLESHDFSSQLLPPAARSHLGRFE